MSGGADAVSVEESPRANLKLMSPMVLFEAVWLESPASQSGLAKVVEILKVFAALGTRFFDIWPHFQPFGPGLGP